jgi:hypothetical protein
MPRVERGVVTAEERQVLVDEREEIQDTLRENTSTMARGIDEQYAKDKLRHIDKTLDQGVELTAKKRDDLIREGKNIIKVLEEGLCTRDEMAYPKRFPGAVRKHMRWEDKNREAIARYHFIRDVIDDDDLLPYIETMRK